MPVPADFETYVKDHLGGAVFGSNLAERLAKENPDGEHAQFLAQLQRDVEKDRQTLLSLADQLGFSSSTVKEIGARVGELASRAKMHGGSALSRFMELETMMLGVSGKLALWEAMAKTPSIAGAVGDKVDLNLLIERARAQRDGLERHRLIAARDAFAADT